MVLNGNSVGKGEWNQAKEEDKKEGIRSYVVIQSEMRLIGSRDKSEEQVSESKAGV